MLINILNGPSPLLAFSWGTYGGVFHPYPWIAHVRQIANSNGVNYAQALSDPSTRISYYTMQGKPVPPLKVRSNWGCATPLGTQAKRKLSVARTKVERKQTPSEERKRALRAKYGVKERGE